MSRPSAPAATLRSVPHAVERCAAACAERAWRLARALLRDGHEAHDAVQQAFLVAARKPDAVPVGDPWPWFRVVVAHEAHNLRRKRRPLPASAWTSPGPGDDGPAEGGPMEIADPRAVEPSRAAAATEELARLHAALDALPAAEREALVLTGLGGLTHAEAASVLGVARQTVTDRARRGMATLTARAARGEAATWQALAVLPVAAPVEGLAEATTTWVTEAMAAVGTGAALAGGAAAGGMTMASLATKWTVGIAAAAAALGFVGGAATDGLGWRREAPPPSIEAPAPPAALGAVRAGAGDGTRKDEPSLAAADDAATTVRRLREENARLLARVEGLERDLVARARAADKASRGPTFTFGDMGRLDAVREADWPALASAAHVVGATIGEITRLVAAGEPVPKELHLRLQEHTELVRRYEYRTLGRMPTAAQHNGELTHPISATNLLAGILEQAGLPLTPAQVAEFERLGLAFEDEFARVRAGWTDDVPRARRLVHELALKGRFMDALWASLSEAQRPLWVDPAYRGVAGVDLFDPTLLVLHTSPVLTGSEPAELGRKLSTLLRKKLALADDAGAPRLDAAVAAWQAAATRGSAPVEKARVKQYTFADALRAGEATATLVETLLRDLDLAPAVADALRKDPAWYVPRLVEG